MAKFASWPTMCKTPRAEQGQEVGSRTHPFCTLQCIAGHRHAGIGIPASCVSVRYRSIPVPDWVLLSRYLTGSGIGVFVHSGTGLIRCRTVRHSGIDNKVHPARQHCKLNVVESDIPCMSIDGCCCWCY
jgi:hypothetical protein